MLRTFAPPPAHRLTEFIMGCLRVEPMHHRELAGELGLARLVVLDRLWRLEREGRVINLGRRWWPIGWVYDGD